MARRSTASLSRRAPWIAVGAALAAALAGDAPPAVGEPAAPGAVTLSIVGTNDLHGGIVPRDGVGGVALLSGYVRNLRAARERDGGAVLLVDGGDMFQGTLESNLTEGASVVAAYNVLGYTAAAVGNHEFDFGPVGPAATPRRGDDDPRGALKARAAEAAFPFLAANLLDEATGRPVDWPNVRPSALVQAAGLKVGIVGVMTREALSATIAGNVRGLRVAPLAPTIAREASHLRERGAAAVIVAAHAGGRCTDLQHPADLTSCHPEAEILAVARELPAGSVDLIVAGHTHAAMAHEVAGVAIIEAYAGGRAFGRVDLLIDRRSGKAAGRRIFPPRDLCAQEDPLTGRCSNAPAARQAQYEGLPVAPDPALADVLAPALARVSAVKARPLGVVLQTPVRRQGTVESPLGNLFTDALREAVPGADASLHNTTGGLRSDLPRGPLVYGSVYEVMPFDNKVVPLKLTGAELKAVIRSHLSSSRRTLGIGGLRVRAACAPHGLDVTLLRPSGAPVGDTEPLTVVASDFLATGGDGILTPVIPPHGFHIPEDAPLARDVLAESLRRRGGQLREEDLVDPDNPRMTYPGPLPAACPK
jgi:5'-nucleotidase